MFHAQIFSSRFELLLRWMHSDQARPDPREYRLSAVWNRRAGECEAAQLGNKDAQSAVLQRWEKAK